MDFKEAFKILEIEPTKDKKKIKVAYSKMLKKYHPEEFPEMFMRINEAYEKALGYLEGDYEEYGYDEVFYENYENDIQMLDDEDTEFADIFSGEYEWIEKDLNAWLKGIYNIVGGKKISFNNLKIFLKRFERFPESEKSRIRNILELEDFDCENNLILNSGNINELEKKYIISYLTENKIEQKRIEDFFNTNAWLEEFYDILNGKKISFRGLKVFLKKFDRFSENEKSRIRDVLGVENIDYESNLILKSDDILEFEKKYIISRLASNETELEKIEKLYNSKEKESKDKAVESFVEKYFNVKKLNIFGFFIFWNIYRGNYEYFDIKINKKIYNFFFILMNNLILKRVVYDYKKIQEIFYRMEITCDDEIKDEDNLLYGLVFLLSSLALFFILVFSLPVITNMGLEEIAYEDIMISFESVKTFWIVLAVTRVYYDFMIAKRGNNLNMPSMLYVQIILLGSYLIAIYFKYDMQDMLLLGILMWFVVKLMIVNSIKYYRLKKYAKKILDKIY